VPTIYGAGSGKADATIETVSFARSDDDLVTTFRVKGTISSSYSYQIGVVFYEEFDGDYSYKIFTYRHEEPGIYSYGRIITKHSALYDKMRNTTEEIASIFKGDTWTATIPLSLIGYSTHFWVWVGVFDQLKEDWVDLYPPTGQQDNFEVSLPARLTVFVEPTWLTNEIKLNFDGIDQTPFASGEFLIETQSGITHTISVTPVIQSSEDVRYVVGDWSDDQYAKETRYIWLDRDTVITVSYSMEMFTSTTVESHTTTATVASPTVSSVVTAFTTTYATQYQTSTMMMTIVLPSFLGSLSISGPTVIVYALLGVIVLLIFAVFFAIAKIAKNRETHPEPPS
jgi:hypothetical protein